MSSATANVYADFQGLANLKAQARVDQDATLDQVARQFESILTQMMVRSMREANLGEGLMESDQTLFYRDMYDQQLTLHLSEQRGLGLAEVIKRQLSPAGEVAGQNERDLEYYRLTAGRTVPVQAADFPRDERPEPKMDDPQSFVHHLWPQAQEAAQALGLPAEALLAQAALETGWGRGMIRSDNGGISHNLFNIKADHRWDGGRVAVSTLEYEQGVAVRRRDYFRAYDSFADSFRDYVDFVKSSPRYQQAQAATADPETYFQELQQAGYATDPAYAEKVVRVMKGPEMRVALQQLKI